MKYVAKRVRYLTRIRAPPPAGVRHARHGGCVRDVSPPLSLYMKRVTDARSCMQVHDNTILSYAKWRIDRACTRYQHYCEEVWAEGLWYSV